MTAAILFFAELNGSTLMMVLSFHTAEKSPPRDRPNSRIAVSVGVPSISCLPCLLTTTSPPVLLNMDCESIVMTEPGNSENVGNKNENQDFGAAGAAAFSYVLPSIYSLIQSNSNVETRRIKTERSKQTKQISTELTDETDKSERKIHTRKE